MLLQRAKFLRILATIFVSDTSVGQQSADSTSAAVNLEVEELAWDSDLRASVETHRHGSWSPVFCSAFVVGTCEVLLHVRKVLHAIVESLELRIQLEGLVGQMHAVVNVRHEAKICNTWLGAHQEVSVIIEQLTDNVKAIHDLRNTSNAVNLSPKEGHFRIDELIVCNSLELMSPCTLLRGFTDELWAVLLCDVVVNGVSL